MNRLVSVVIPAYNSQDTIEACIRSVINQDYEGEVEIVVVNDGSSDSTSEKVNDLNNAIGFEKIKIIHKENGGVSSARNVGMLSSKGEIIALLDADDVWLPNKLSKQVSIMDEFPEIDFLGCARNSESLSLFGRKITYLHQATHFELLIKMFPQTSTAIFKRSLIEKVGVYNELLTHGEDGNLWLRFCVASNFYYMPDSLVITGNGKPNYGHSGLSSNLTKMQEGVEYSLNELYKDGHLSKLQYLMFYLYSKIKYWRRVAIVEVRRVL